MIKLEQTLKQASAANRPAFMMHLVAGYPDLEASSKIAAAILEAGADILEIQIPFSDPVADGPVIAKANEQSLHNGTTVESSLKMIEDLARSTAKPILIMSYFNIIHKYGIENFCQRAASIGVEGLIVPDYPFDEEAGNLLLASCEKHSLATIQVLAATTRKARLSKISKLATGFVYCVARTGTTGNKTQINESTIQYLQTVRQHISIPMAVGFGLSERAQIKALSPYAEIMIVGSALIREYTGVSLEQGLENTKRFVTGLTSEE